MKFILGLFVGMGIMFCLAMLQLPIHNSHIERIYVEGDEMPGIGGSDDQPDTCYGWYDQRDNMIHMANSSWMKPVSKTSFKQIER